MEAYIINLLMIGELHVVRFKHQGIDDCHHPTAYLYTVQYITCYYLLLLTCISVYVKINQ